MSRIERITEAVKRHDPLLFCEKRGHITSIYRKDHYMDFIDCEFGRLWYPRSNPYHVFALTHNWSVHGTPVEWGVLPIMNRLKAIDLWNQGYTIDQLEEDHNRIKRSKLNDFKNTTEDMLYDMRSQFARSTNDINTSLLAKVDKRRLEDGYCK